MPVWKSSSFIGRSMIMNKKSQFTKIFSQAILDMKDTGTLDIIFGENSREMHHSYNLPNPKEKTFQRVQGVHQKGQAMVELAKASCVGYMMAEP